MNLFKRISLGILRRPIKSLLLALITFVLSLFIFFSFSINKSMDIIRDNIIEEIGSYLTVHTNDYSLSKSKNEKFESDLLNELFLINNNEIKTLYVSIDFQSMYSDKISHIDRIYKSTQNDNFNLNSSYLVLGVNQSQFSELKHGNIEITEGRSFTQEEILNNKKVIILNNNIKKVNDTCDYINFKNETYTCSREYKNIKLGDKIELNRVVKVYQQMDKQGEGFIITQELDVSRENVEYEVIGFFEEKYSHFNNTFNTDNVYSDETSYDIIMPIGNVFEEFEQLEILRNDYLKKFNIDEFNVNKNQIQINSVLFDYNNPDTVNEFANNVETILDKKFDGIFTISSKETYESVAKPIESLSNVSSLMLTLSIVISLIILSLVIIIFIKERKKEIGIYLALGETKLKTSMQIILQFYLVGLLAMSLSLATSTLTSKYLFNEICENFVVTELDTAVNGDLIIDDYNVKSIIDETVIEPNSKEVTYMFLIGSTVFLLASIIAIYYILRLEPKKILM